MNYFEVNTEREVRLSGEISPSPAGNFMKLAALAGLALVILIFTFPYLEPDIAPGLDGSYFLVINHFFATDITRFREIIHTYGPFGFITGPMVTGNNFATALAIISAIRFLQISLLLYLGSLLNKSWVTTTLICILFMSMLRLEYSFYTILAACIFIYRNNSKPGFLVAGAIIASFGLFVKITIGLHCFLILSSFSLVELLYYKKRKETLIMLLTYVISSVVLWFSIYRTFSNLFMYVKGWFFYSLGNTDYTVLYPPNNLFLLFGSVLIFFLIPMLARNKETTFFYLIFTLSLFAFYKYSVARQEGTHSRGLLHFMIFFSLMFFIAIRNIKPYMIIIFLLGIGMYVRNLQINKTYHSDFREQIIGVNNFFNMVLDHEEYKRRFIDLSMKNIENYKLPETMLAKIGSEKIDYTPWDFSYLYIHHLNFKPKPTLQSGALYIPDSFDKLNAAHVKNSKDLKFILWEKDKWNGETGGIDDKYLLNEDGGYHYEIFNNFKIVDESPRVLLMQRTDSARLLTPQPSGSVAAQWDTWIDVPQVTNGYVRAKLDMSPGFCRTLKNIFYKAGTQYVEYQLKNGNIVKHRFSRNTCETGMWVSPYLTEITNELSGEPVLKIRLTYTDQENPMKPGIKIQWEEIKFSGPDSK
jgi:hypothetical protein